jgi:hypothetical protein
MAVRQLEEPGDPRQLDLVAEATDAQNLFPKKD